MVLYLIHKEVSHTDIKHNHRVNQMTNSNKTLNNSYMGILFQVPDPQLEAFYHGVLSSYTHPIQIHTDNARHQIRTVEKGETDINIDIDI